MDSFRLWKRGEPLTSELLRLRVEETQRWCARELAAGAAPSMRSDALAFEILHNGRNDAVTSLGLNRSRALWGQEMVKRQRPHKGRFLVYFPDQQLACGAAEVATDGFFDVFNTPPWDTWVSWFDEDDGYLLCWVPDPLVERVDHGIDVNPEACIRWIEDTDVGVKAALRELGFLDAAGSSP